MIYGYARCSTNEEMQDINRQIRELKQLGATDRTIYREYESGMKNDRVELQRLLETVKSGDTIVATEVSRITRSTKQLCEIIELVKEKHIKLVLGTFVVDCTRELDYAENDGCIQRVGAQHDQSAREKRLEERQSERKTARQTDNLNRRYPKRVLQALSQV